MLLLIRLNIEFLKQNFDRAFEKESQTLIAKINNIVVKETKAYDDRYCLT